MNDRQLLYIVKISEHAGITEAARELFVSPSTLVKSLQKTEAELGMPLFDRIGKFFYPTYAGTRFLQYAKEMLSLHERMNEEMTGLNSLSNDLVRVGFQLNNDASLLRTISDFHKDFPDTEIQISEGTSIRLQDLLDSNDIDFMIVTSLNTNGKWEYERIPLYSNEVVVVTERDHPLVKKAVWQDSRKYPVIDAKLLEQENIIYHTTQPYDTVVSETIMQRICQTQGLSLRSNVRATTISTILKLVSMGNGIALTFDSIAEQFVNSLNLSMLSFGETPMENSLMIVHRKDRYLSKASQKMISMFCERFQS